MRRVAGLVTRTGSMRLDQLLVERGLAPTRSAAQRLIGRGAVRFAGRGGGWSIARKAGDDVAPDTPVELTDDAELRWASRAGLKLEAALAHAQLDVQGRTCLDLGQSHGGFTDVLLACGAARVVGVDVGHGQLLPRLRADPRVTAFEGVNARELHPALLGDAMPAHGFDVAVGDLSFISLTLVLPALPALIAADADVLLLVKPQFELQPDRIGKGGLVKDAADYATVEVRLRSACAVHGLDVRDWFPSSITGGDGNREFFLLASAPSAAAAQTKRSP